MQARVGRAFAVGWFDREREQPARGGSRECCVAGHGASVVASLAERHGCAAGRSQLSAGSPAGAAVVPVAVDRRGRAADSRRAGAHQLRARAVGRLGRSTIHKVLARHGCSRRRRTPRERCTRRYEWAQPGALLHQDTKRLQRFHTPGHWATGGRTEIARNRGAGYVYAHCVVDDRTRLAYVELHSADSAQAAAITLKRAIDWLREQGCSAPQAVMTDNAFVYRHSNAYRQLLASHAARHILTPPYTPRWNGKVERFIQTLDDEWAHGRVWATSTQRDRGLAGVGAVQFDVGQAGTVVDDAVRVDVAGAAVTAGAVAGRPVPRRVKALQALGVHVQQRAGLGPLIAPK